MHIMEGFLPWYWCLFWYIISLPIVAYGIIKLKKIIGDTPEAKSLLAVTGGFMFLLSSLKLPSVAGSSSHPTGNGLGGVIFGPAISAVLATIVLIFQALLLAHGGITTLGANIFSMGIIGPLVAWIVYKGIVRNNTNTNNEVNIKKSNFSKPSIAMFLGAFLANISTYIVTSFQLAIAFPEPTVELSFIKFLLIFAIPQVSLGICEGLITVIIWENLAKVKFDVLKRLNVFN
ncbi:MAG: cobalt ECF transporter S component CbiM [Methanobacteriaceae archaeon]